MNATFSPEYLQYIYLKASNNSKAFEAAETSDRLPPPAPFLYVRQSHDYVLSNSQNRDGRIP
jgi:hypothetical protein